MSLGFYTVVGNAENTTVIERSKFICYAKGVENEEEAKEFIASIKTQNSLATHNCYAYVADDKGLIAKFSDDGEPQGTAGLPMLEVLKNKKFYKTAVVVTRYFGGIKLGTGGLTRAYSGAVLDCLNVAKSVNMLSAEFLELNLDYDGYSKLLKLVDEEVRVVDSNFGEKISISLAVKQGSKEKFTKKLSDAFCGNIDIKVVKSGYFGF